MSYQYVGVLRFHKTKIIKILIWGQVLFCFSLLLKVEHGPSFTNVAGSETELLANTVAIHRLQIPTTTPETAPYKFDQKFNHLSWRENQNLQLTDDSRQYFKTVEGVTCFSKGTNFIRTAKFRNCVCLDGFYGPHCGIPESAWKSHFSKHPKDLEKLKPRTVPRRIVHGIQVNHEFDFFEARVHDLDDVVDAYIMLESNYSSYGEVKPLRFLDKFRDGWLRKFQDKIIYVFLDFFPEKAEDNGWYADSFLRSYMSKNGLDLIQNKRDDDIFLLLDADELPCSDALLFLKVFDGWTEPVRFGFRWNVFGFFWLKSEGPGLLESLPLLGKLMKQEKKEQLLTLYVVCTLGMLSTVYGNNAMLLRKNVWSHKLLESRLQNYTVHHQKPKEWQLGSVSEYAGHHCSWCYEPQGIKIKMESAQRHDSPRWGDYPDKLRLPYLEDLVRTGTWFDSTQTFIPIFRGTVRDEEYAPKYFIENDERFEYLMAPPFTRL